MISRDLPQVLAVEAERLALDTMRLQADEAELRAVSGALEADIAREAAADTAERTSWVAKREAASARVAELRAALEEAEAHEQACAKAVEECDGRLAKVGSHELP